MDEEIERLLISVRADTGAFARDVADLRNALDGPLASGAERAGRGIEAALVRAVATGKLGFDDLRRVALRMLDDIASAALKSGIDALLGSGGRSGGGGGIGGAIGSLLSGLAGRAIGGPVSPATPYLVGERGPELFVPTAAGRIEPVGGGARDVRIAIAVHAQPGDAPAALAQSSRQVARAVRAALMEAR